MEPIRTGDYVEIIRPLRFIRCGYELTPGIAGEIILRDHEQDVVEFLHRLGIITPKCNYAIPQLEWDPETRETRRKMPKLRHDHRAMKKFLSGLGYLYTHAHKFGNPHRQIFNDEFDAAEYVNCQLKVIDKASVVTGFYCPPGGDGEDYEPGSLSNQQNNSIVRLNLAAPELDHSTHPGFWMEARNLRKMADEDVEILTADPSLLGCGRSTSTRRR